MIDYLKEENRVLNWEKRFGLNDEQRRRLAAKVLAAKAKKLGRRILKEVVAIVTPGTLLAWRES